MGGGGGIGKEKLCLRTEQNETSVYYNKKNPI